MFAITSNMIIFGRRGGVLQDDGASGRVVVDGQVVAAVQEATTDEIAAQVGYSSVYAFATAFRRHHGEPPHLA